MFVLALLPNEIEALKAGKRVTKTYPEPLPYEWPPLLSEDLDALRAGETVIQMSTDEHPQVVRFVRVGNVFPVESSERPHYGPPPLLPADLEALMAGKTMTKTLDHGPPHHDPKPDLNVRVVEYRQQGQDHIYTLEAV